MGPKTHLYLVMMWLHCIVRRRKYIGTAFELIFAIGIYISLYLWFDSNFKDPPGAGLFNIQRPESIQLSETAVPQCILYTPETNFTQKLMEKVAQKLDLPPLDSFPGRNLRGYYPFQNYSEIYNYVKSSNMKRDDAVVIFEMDKEYETNSERQYWNLEYMRKSFEKVPIREDSPLPRHLNYTIRMKTPFMTQMMTSMDGLLVPHQSFGTIYEPFMRLQWAIDTSYLEMLSGDEVKQTVTLQEFPYVGKLGSNNEKLQLMLVVLRWASYYAMLLPFVFLVARLIEEKANGIQELMKMSGVSGTILSVSHFLNSMIVGFLIALVGAITLCLKHLPNTSTFLMFLALLLYAMTILALGFATSYVVNSAKMATPIAILIYLLIDMPGLYLSNYVPAPPIVFGLLPGVPINWVYNEVVAVEQYGVGLTFKNMAQKNSSNSESVLVALIFMVLQTLLLAALVWYLDKVRPGPFGQTRPCCFLFQRKKNDVDPDAEEEVPMTQDQRYFEKSKNGEVGIKVVNVTKVYPKHRALHNVSLNVYEGEITVLLGHNGAGKTTLMSIMTGMISQTSGSVHVLGLAVAAHPVAARRQIGFCPQAHMFYPKLTVLEHVKLFAMIRGSTLSQASKSSKHLLEQLGIAEKANSLSVELSGGMKRRLQLACALAGNASVLILDEPTSGLDVETRRELWDLLLSLRGSRTVLISTHFMEEADALGDRVAALHAGRLRCHASPIYLKKAVGTGYRLTFTTIGQPNEPAITAVIKDTIPEATLKEASLNSISYSLPAANSSAFPKLFTKLEEKRSELGIDSIGVGASTLEEVFLLLCSDASSTLTQDEIDGIGGAQPTHPIATGPRLWLRQFWVLVKRQISYLVHRKYLFLIFQFLLPVLVIVCFGLFLKNGPELDKKSSSLVLTPEMYSGRPSRVLYGPGARGGLRALAGDHPEVEVEQELDIEDAILRIGEEDPLKYHKYLAGIDLNGTNAKVMFTTTVRHAAPVALNLLSGTLASLLPSGAARLSVRNEPLESLQATPPALVLPKDILLLYLLLILLVAIILTTYVNLTALPIAELKNGSRHIHIMAGCSPELYWLAVLPCHLVLGAVTLILPAMIICVFDADRTISDSSFIVAFGALLVMGSAAFLASLYVITFWPALSNLLLPVFIMLGVIMMLMDMAYSSTVWSVLFRLSEFVNPTHALLGGAGKCARAAFANAQCALNRKQCAVLAGVPDFKECCASTGNVQCYFCFDGIGRAFLILFLQFCGFMAILFALQRGVFNFLCQRLVGLRYSAPEPRYRDEMARAERAYVSKAVDLPKRQIQDQILVSDVHKMYPRACRKSVKAMRGVSFSVKKGECFGLLGVNGAGKTSTFRVLTTEEWPTRGQVYSNGHHRKGFSTDYMRGLGYCPQFFGLDEFQTGQQNLALLLTLRGLDERDVQAETASWIQVVGLEKYAMRAVSGYSGGCQRRLAAAASLCTGKPLSLLDEPTSGVDVSARRRVWAALRRGLQHQRAIILTSHSMDEMEALCHRIAILSGGEVAALGSPAALRAHHAAGHAVTLKLTPPDAGQTTSTQMNELKGAMLRKFECTLKDEHKTMLHFHINETMPYSRLFQEMESLKKSFPDFIEDYAVTETTLEEVFLSFARPDDEPDAPAGTQTRGNQARPV